LPTDKLRFHKIPSNDTQAAILQAIRDNNYISRSRIVDLTSLTHAVVSRSVALLLEKNIITESRLADKNGPRRKNGVSLNPQLGYCLAIEYGPSAIEGVIVDTAYNQISAKNQKIPLDTAPQDEKIKHIIAFTEELIKCAPHANGQCLGLAVIDPGVIDEKSNIALMSSIMQNWQNVPIVDIFQKHFRLPVMLLNSSIAKIKAVDRIELNGASKNIAYIEYGDGISCGLKLEGNYIHGHTQLAGELGHLRVTDKPIPCRCGGLGCLESVAAFSALVRNARESLNENSRSILSKIDLLDGSAVLSAAAAGDRLASHIVDEAFDYLGRAIAGLINIFNPEIIILDHNISIAGPEAFASLMRSLSKNSLLSHWKIINARITKLNSRIGALGGATAVLDHCLQN